MRIGDRVRTSFKSDGQPVILHGVVKEVRDGPEIGKLDIKFDDGNIRHFEGPTYEIVTVKMADGVVYDFKASDLSLLSPAQLRVAS